MECDEVCCVRCVGGNRLIGSEGVDVLVKHAEESILWNGHKQVIAGFKGRVNACFMARLLPLVSSAIFSF